MLQPKRTPRLRRILPVMIVSILALAGFLGYWLQREYLAEKAQLQKDLRQLVADEKSRLKDSLIQALLIKPLELKFKSAGGRMDMPLSDSLQFRDSGTFFYSEHPRRVRTPLDVRLRVTTDTGARAKDPAWPLPGRVPVDSFATMRFRMDGSGADSYFSATRSLITGADGRTTIDREYRVVRRGESREPPADDSLSETVLRSVKLLITSLAEIPGQAEGYIDALDTLVALRAYGIAVRDAGISAQLYWQADTASLQHGGLSIEEKSTGGRTLYARGFEGALFKRLGPAILFSAFLLCLTVLAFGMTYRALRSQMQLAAIRNDLISNMSHELKTPVSTVKVALEALSEPEVLRNTSLAADYLEMADLELARLELLINQALQSALLEGGRVQIERRPVHLDALAAQMLRAMQGRFAQLGGSAGLVAEGSGFLIQGDALQLQGVIVNILDNALKYAGPAPKVLLRITEQPDSIRIQIDDEGPGIPEEYRSSVFDKFFRVPSGNEHSVKGYGLGLNYAAWVVRQHGGSIRVSTSARGGSRFEIILPKAES